MRNIYDIISEQKAMIDINIASYDLQYTNEHFIKNQDRYYMQEGFGEAVKKGAKKVVEFIKAIIKKIKELINKVIGFFKKSETTVEDLEKQIKDAANSVGSTGAAKVAADGAVNVAKKAAEEKNEAKPKPEPPKIAPGPGTKVSGLLDVLKKSNTTVEFNSFATLDSYEDTLLKTYDAVESLIGPELKDRYPSLRYFDSHVGDKVFGGNEFRSTPGDPFIERLKDRYEYTGERKSTKISSIAETIYKYAKEGVKSAKSLKKMEKTAEDRLNKLARAAESGESEETILSFIEKGASIISQATHFIVQAITRATSTSIAICRKATTDFCNSVKK